MKNPEIADVEKLPIQGHRADLVGHVLLGVGAILHTLGGKILRARNEQLTDDLQAAHASITEAGHAAYALGRQHERDGVPMPDVVDVTAAAVDVDGHQGDNPAAAPSSAADEAAKEILEHGPAQQ